MRVILFSALLAVLVSQSLAQWGACGPLKRDASSDFSTTNPFGNDLASEALDRVFRPVHYALRDMDANGHKTARAVAADQSCRTQTFPYDYSNSSSGNFTIRIMRFKRATPSTRQLWLVPGGPGEAASDLAVIGSIVAERNEADVYLVDFRGLGSSNPLFYCPTENGRLGFAQSGVAKSRWQTCYNEMQNIFGNNLLTFTTSNAARDLNHAIQSVRAEDSTTASQEVWVAGLSYGTYFVNRFLILFPNTATGAILDGVIYGPEGTNLFSMFDYNVNLKIDKVMTACRADAYCRTKITTDTFVADTVRKLFSGSCPRLTDKVSVNDTMVFLKYAFGTQAPRTQAIPMLFYRLNRCDAKLDGQVIDTVAFGALASIPKEQTAPGARPTTGYSWWINNFISINEVYDFTKTAEQHRQLLRTGSMGESQLLISAFHPLRNVVPVYTEPLRANGFNTTSLQRALFLSGEWDANTPPAIASAMFPSFTITASSDSNAKTHVIVPKAGHIQFFLGCGADVAAAVIKRDNTALNTALASSACSQGPTIDYQNVRDVAPLFGLSTVSNVWDDPVPQSSAAFVGASTLVSLAIAAALTLFL